MPNPYHEPAGSSKGGEFAPKPGGSFESAARKAARVTLVSKDESERQLDYVRSLSIDEKKAVRRYTGGDFTWMNRHMRHGNKTSDNIKERIQLLDQAIHNAPSTQEPMQVYRRIGGDPKDLGMVAGSTFIEKGFFSTSYRADTVEGKFITMYVNAPPGSHGLFVEEIGGHSVEKEIIFGPSIFKIKSVTQTDDSSWIIQADLIGDYK